VQVSNPIVGTNHYLKMRIHTQILPPPPTNQPTRHGDGVTSSGRNNNKAVLLHLDYFADGVSAKDTMVECFGERNLRGGTAL
jgi:hypothetical protein